MLPPMNQGIVWFEALKDGLPYHEPPYSKDELRDLEAKDTTRPPSPSTTLAQLVGPSSPPERVRNNR